MRLRDRVSTCRRGLPGDRCWARKPDKYVSSLKDVMQPKLNPKP